MLGSIEIGDRKKEKDIGGWLHLSDGQFSGDPRMGKERLDQFLNIHTGSAQGGSWGLLARPIQVALNTRRWIHYGKFSFRDTPYRA